MKPIFEKCRSEMPNIHCGFRHDLELSVYSSVEIVIGARSFYRLYLNGAMVCHGGARTGEDHLRMDRIDLLKYVRKGTNRIAVEVASYGNFRNYSNDITCEDGVLLAEVLVDRKIVLETDESWKAVPLTQKRLNVDQYSHCREISELYYLDDEYYSWRTDDAGEEVEVLPSSPKLLERSVPYPEYRVYERFSLMEIGSVVKFREDILRHFYEKEEECRKLPERPSCECENENEIAFCGAVDGDGAIQQGEHSDGTYLLYDIGAMTVGFKGIKVTCECDTVIDFIHAERIEDNGHLSARPSQNTALRLHLPAGSWNFLSFEPYGMRYFKVVIRSKRKVSIDGLYVVEYTYPDTKACGFLTNDGRINRIFNAARKTLRLCTLDVFMDCPDRERGGWLCDSFWMARTQKMLFGDTSVEKAMLHNFLQFPEKKRYRGLFPSCYPSYSVGGTRAGSINTWTMWLLLQVMEYSERSGDAEILQLYESSMEAFIQGMLEYLNRYGLLEDIPGFTFVDWGAANNPYYNSPISTAANMLFAKLLLQAGTVYKKEAWKNKAQSIVSAVMKYARTADGISDSLDAPTVSSPPHARSLYSESAHYLSFWTGLVDDPDLLDVILRRENNMAGTKFAPANMFIGYCIRHDLLSMNGEIGRLVEESLDIYGKMIDQGPDTLWETFGGRSSRCHGFASYIGCLYMKDILGINSVNEIKKTIRIKPHPLHLRWAKGSTVLNGGVLAIHWENAKDKFIIDVTAPKGYRVEFLKDGVDGGTKATDCNVCYSDGAEAGGASDPAAEISREPI